MKHLIMTLTLGACLLATSASGEEFSQISIKELKSAIEAGGVTVIDVNGSTIYRKGHIPGAIDYRANKEKLASLLPKNKDALIVTYCGGPECYAYRAAAENAGKLGYKNVKYLPVGIVGWMEAGEPLEKAE